MKSNQASSISSITAIATFAALLTCGSASAATFNALQDATIYDNGNANGAGQGLFVGQSGASITQRGLIEFDLSSIAAGSTITSVSLTMHVNATGSAKTTDTITLNKVNQAWNAGTQATGGTTKGGGSGTTAAAGDATWTSSGFNAWPAGGDFDAVLTDSISVSGVGFYTFTGVNLLTDIQAWVDDPTANFGWILLGNEVVASSSKRFSSSENTGNGGVNVPMLNIEFQTTVVPVPAAVWLFGSGLLGLVGLARRKCIC